MPDPIDPEVIRAMRRFKRLLDEREAATMLEMVRRWAQLERALVEQLELLAAEIAAKRAAGQVVTADAVRLTKRYAALQQQVRDQIAQYADYAAQRVTREQEWMAQAGIDHSAEMLRATLARGGAGAFDVLPVEALQRMAGYVADGSPLRAYFAKMYPEAVQGIMDALFIGMARGWAPGRIAKYMRDALGVAPRTAINSARTETLRVYREASLQQYRASGLVDGYIRVAAKSVRTCMACLAKDGEWFPLSIPFEEHNQGRCRPIPAKQGQTYPGTKGLDWFVKQPPERQRIMLGSGRYEAWKANRFDLKDIAKLHKDSVWGNSWQERSLKDLLSGGGAGGPPVQKLPMASAQPPPNPAEAKAIELGYRTGPQARAELAGLAEVKQSIDALDRRIGDYQTMIIEEDVKLSRLKRGVGGPVNPQDAQFIESTIGVYKRSLDDLREQRAKLITTFQDKSAAIVDVPKERWLQVGIKSKAALADAWQAGVDRFRRLVDGGPFVTDRVITFKSNRGRAYFDLSTNIVHADGRLYTIVHELGHWLEAQSGYIHSEALKFLARRTQGEALQWMGPGYGLNERTRPDKFRSPYIGKDYGEMATEVISMGLQYMAEDPVAFAREDPDMFDFIYYLMRGLI